MKPPSAFQPQIIPHTDLSGSNIIGNHMHSKFGLVSLFQMFNGRFQKLIFTPVKVWLASITLAYFTFQGHEYPAFHMTLQR